MVDLSGFECLTLSLLTNSSVASWEWCKLICHISQSFIEQFYERLCLLAELFNSFSSSELLSFFAVISLSVFSAKTFENWGRLFTWDFSVEPVDSRCLLSFVSLRCWSRFVGVGEPCSRLSVAPSVSGFLPFKTFSGEPYKALLKHIGRVNSRPVQDRPFRFSNISVNLFYRHFLDKLRNLSLPTPWLYRPVGPVAFRRPFGRYFPGYPVDFDNFPKNVQREKFVYMLTSVDPSVTLKLVLEYSILFVFIRFFVSFRFFTFTE